MKPPFKDIKLIDMKSQGQLGDLEAIQVTGKFRILGLMDSNAVKNPPPLLDEYSFEFLKDKYPPTLDTSNYNTLVTENDGFIVWNSCLKYLPYGMIGQVLDKFGCISFENTNFYSFLDPFANKQYLIVGFS